MGNDGYVVCGERDGQRVELLERGSLDRCYQDFNNFRGFDFFILFYRDGYREDFMYSSSDRRRFKQTLREKAGED